MEAARPWIVLFCVTIYMAACVWVGLWAMKRTKNAGDFFMAGRHLGAFVTAMAVFSSTLSGFGEGLTVADGGIDPLDGEVVLP